MIDPYFGKRFKECLKKSGLTNKEITEKLQVSKNNIGNYKNGQIPNAKILYGLSQLLGITMEYLLTGKKSEELTPEEQELIDRYRMSDERGKRNIMITAKTETENSKSYICPTGGGTGTGSL